MRVRWVGDGKGMQGNEVNMIKKFAGMLFALCIILNLTHFENGRDITAYFKSPQD